MVMTTVASGRARGGLRSQQIQESRLKKSSNLFETYKNFSDSMLGINADKPINALELFEAEDGQGWEDPIRTLNAARSMNNFIEKTREIMAKGQLDETSRASMPNWVKNGLGLIAAAQSDNIIDQVVSEQSMPSRNGRIHYLDIQTERAKGQTPDRAKIFDALSGFRGTDDISGEEINKEPIAAGGGVTYSGTIGYGPIIPGSLRITDGVQVISDDRNGNLVGSVGPIVGNFTNTVNYLSREFSVVFAAATSGPVRASYKYNIEAALKLAEYGIALRSEDVQARPRALGASWSQQAVIDFMADFGIDAEPTIIEAGSRIIMMEKFKHIVNTLRANATGGTFVFDNTPPVAVSYRDHLKTLGLFVSRLQDLIFEATQVVRPNVMIVHPSVMFAIAFLDGFEGQSYANDGIAGPRRAGRLTKHDIDVFVDPTYPRDQGLLTHRGADFVSTAAVVGNYIDLYKAPVHQQGFRRDFALLSEYVIKVINGDQIGTFAVTNL